MTSKPISLFRAAFVPLTVVAMTSFSQAATLLNNGGFENWTNPLVPDGWTRGSEVIVEKVTGLDGSGFAVLLASNGPNNNQSAALTQTITTAIGPSSSFSYSMDFAQSANTGRVMNATLRNSGTGQTILNFAVINGQLNTYNIGTTSFNPISTFTLSIDTAYRMVVNGNLTTGGTYSVELYALTDLINPVISVANQTRWQVTPTASTIINSINLERGRSTASWTADNVSLIPEPTSALLVGLGALGFAARRRR